MPFTVQPWSGDFTTRNYVKYQVARSGEPSRTNPSSPNMCLVVGTGVNYVSSHVLGLGAISPFCRVSTYGFLNTDPNYAWDETSWLYSSEDSPRYADEGINMVVRIPTLDVGASFTFTWAYILNLVRCSRVVLSVCVCGTPS